MNLDWNFYFDEWLIDKVPDGMYIDVEEHPQGIVLNPPSMTCYFGANPIYLYGKGKLFHESLMSPSGITIYPEFLNRPGFEFVEEITFNASFSKSLDYWGNNVRDKHVGWVNALEYMNNIAKTIYGVGEGEYVGTQTPSSKLRAETSEDYHLQQEGFSGYQMFASTLEMIDNGCVMYLRMDTEVDKASIHESISNTYFPATAPGALIAYPGSYSSVLFTKYTYVEVSQAAANVVSSNEFEMLFLSLPEFRPGVIFDFGSTNISSGQNYGFRLDIATTGFTITINDGNLNVYEFPFETDFRFTYKWSISRKDNSMWIVRDGKIQSFRDDILSGGVLFDPSLKNYISGRSVDTKINTDSGDLEEIAFFNTLLSDEMHEKYYQEFRPVLKSGGVDAIAYENIPISLSYAQTYNKPTEFFIPNFFGGVIDKYYLSNSSGILQIVGGKEATDESHVTGMEPRENKSILINNGFMFQAVTTSNHEENVDFNIGEKIPVLTKLTSDTHIPLRIYMKFKIPPWHDKRVTYNMRLVLKSLDKFLWYTFEKFKTGEFV